MGIGLLIKSAKKELERPSSVVQTHSHLIQRLDQGYRIK